jgi:AbrB family looped-hinge helix DNA binding protein
MDVAITRMSSKGQVVIPAEMRVGISEGEKLLLIRHDHQIILKKASDLGKSLEEDLRFAERTEDAFRRYQRGEFKQMDFNDFIKEAKKW